MLAAFDLGTVLGLTAAGVVLLVVVGLAVYLGLGLFNARSLVRRELAAYFFSPIAYVVLVVFLLVTGYRFYLTLEQLTASGPRGVEFPMQYLLSLFPRTAEITQFTRELLSGLAFWLVYLVIPPVLTMRLFAEERGSGTLEMLMTSPLRDWQVVLSKYVACWLFYLFLWVPTLVYLPVLLNVEAPTGQLVQLVEGQITVGQLTRSVWTYLLGGGLAALVAGLALVFVPVGSLGRVWNLILFLGGAACIGVGIWGHYRYDSAYLLVMPARIDPYPVLSSYLGLILAGSMLLALGLFVSSLVRDQLVAFLVSLALSLVFIVTGFRRPDLDSDNVFNQVVQFLSLPQHLSEDFCRGLIDSRHVVLYGSVALFCLFLTVRSLESRRWR
jgi:ABC-type transport system involved in multi-copper enzyme maturation permease subunit